jgi:hypothetical protein
VNKAKRKWLSKDKHNTDHVSWDVTVKKEWHDANLTLSDGSSQVFIDLRSCDEDEVFNFDVLTNLQDTLDELRSHMYVAAEKIKSRKAAAQEEDS